MYQIPQLDDIETRVKICLACKGVAEIRSYIESNSEKVESDSTESTESTSHSDFYKFKDNDGKTHQLEFELKSYDEPEAGYYNTVVNLYYGEEM